MTLSRSLGTNIAGSTRNMADQMPTGSALSKQSTGFSLNLGESQAQLKVSSSQSQPREPVHHPKPSVDVPPILSSDVIPRAKP